MGRAIKYELYKLISEQFLWVTAGVILLIAFVMDSGSGVTIEKFAQKSFITSVIASLYAAAYTANDFDNENILYLVLSGNSRFKIVIIKFIGAFISSEVLVLLYPVTQAVIRDEWASSVKCVILLAYFVLGIFLAALGLFLAWLFKNPGLSVIGAIVFHVLSLLLMNSKGIGTTAMNILPEGITKLLIEGQTPFCGGIIIAFWIAALLTGGLILSRCCDL